MTIKEKLAEDVYLALQAIRKSSSESLNDVLRRLMSLPEPQKQNRDWITKYGQFNHGTVFRAIYKGKVYNASVDDGALMYDGKRYTSPTAASCYITDVQTTGGRFWKVKVSHESSEWIFISEFKALSEYKLMQ